VKVMAQNGRGLRGYLAPGAEPYVEVDSSSEGYGEDRAVRALLGVLATWLVMAAVGQLAYAAHWPLFVWGRQVSYSSALVLTFLRAGVYGGLAWGLIQRRQEAWAGSVVELGRTVLLFVVLAVQDQEGWGLYPAAWSQGVLAAMLPFLVAAGTFSAFGCSLGSSFEDLLFFGCRLTVAGALLGSLVLRRLAGRFEVPGYRQFPTLLRYGLPYAVVLTGGEMLAFVVAAQWRPA